jgi:hypothetical protein
MVDLDEEIRSKSGAIIAESGCHPYGAGSAFSHAFNWHAALFVTMN